MPATRIWIVATALGLFLLPQGIRASIITAVEQTGGGVETGVNLVSGGLADGALVYTDRTHLLAQIPAGLVGADYVQLENDHKTDVDFQVDVTISQLSLLYVFLDNRVGGGDSTSSPTALPWMVDGSMGLGAFHDTGVDMAVDEGGDGSLNNAYSLFVTLAPPGTYTFGPQNDGGNRNMYGIAASQTLVVPEPGMLALASLAGIALAWGARRRAG